MDVHATFYVQQYTQFPGWQEHAQQRTTYHKFVLHGVPGAPFGEKYASAALEMVLHDEAAVQMFAEAMSANRRVQVCFSLGELGGTQREKREEQGDGTESTGI